MADDFAANTSTTGRITVNAPIPTTGNIEAVGDRDWFRVFLWSGETYGLQERANASGDGTLGDPVIRLRDSAGTPVGVNDNGGFGNNAYLRFVPVTSGFYFVEAGEADDAHTGTYKVSVVQEADSLGDPHQWGTGATLNDRFGDFAYDGAMDLLQITAGGQARVALSQEEGGFTPFTTWVTGATPSDRIGNVTGVLSGADLVQIYGGTVYVAESNGVSAFSPFMAIITGATAGDRLADINGDERQDLVQIFGGNVYVATASGTASIFNPFAFAGSGATASDQLGGDFNGDPFFPRADLLQLYGGNAYVATGTAAGGFTGYTLWGTGTTASDRFGDFNGDGKDDLIQIYNGTTYVALANTAGTAFNAFQPWGTGATLTDQIGDMNGDGRDDLFQVFGGRALVALANGLGTAFLPFEEWGTGLSPSARIADVGAADGLQDVIDIIGSDISVWKSFGFPD